MRRVILVRHGQSEHNSRSHAEQSYLSTIRDVDAPLSLIGKQQCEYLGPYLPSENTVVWTSQLGRAHQTVSAFMELKHAHQMAELNEFNCHDDETWPAFVERVAAMRSVIERTNFETLVIVGHGQFFNVLLQQMVHPDIPVAKHAVFYTPNASMSSVRYSDRWEINTVGFTPYPRTLLVTKFPDLVLSSPVL